MSRLPGRGQLPALIAASAEHVREWLNAMRAKGNQPATVNTRYRAANGFFKWLVTEGERRDNPLERSETSKVPETIQAHYAPEEIQRVLKALNGRRLKGIDATLTKTILLAVLLDFVGA